MLRRKDLPESTLQSGLFLYCQTCGEQYSATRGDYFLMADDEPLVCECDEPATPLFLARESIRVLEVAREVVPRMTVDERRRTWLELYRGVLANLRPGDPSRPLWRSGSQRTYARAEAHRQLMALERELAAADQVCADTGADEDARCSCGGTLVFDRDTCETRCDRCGTDLDELGGAVMRARPRWYSGQLALVASPATAAEPRPDDPTGPVDPTEWAYYITRDRRDGWPVVCFAAPAESDLDVSALAAGLLVSWERLYSETCAICGARGTWDTMAHEPCCPSLHADGRPLRRQTADAGVDHRECSR